MNRTTLRLAVPLMLAFVGWPHGVSSAPAGTGAFPLASARVATDDGVWSVAPTLHDRSNVGAFVYDPVRDRIILFGGYGNEIHYLGDTWTYSLSEKRWSPLVTTGTPPSGRIPGAAIYDPVRDRMVVFGGSAPGLLSDVWALSLSGTPSWTQLAPTGTPPSGRYGSSAIYDPVRDRMVVFGGEGSGVDYYNDVFALNLSGTPSWTQLLPAGTPPTPRTYAAVVYDPVRDRLVLFGGVDSVSYKIDTWVLNFAGSPTWSTFSTLNHPGYGLGPAVYDAPRDRMVTVSGAQPWELDFAGVPDWHAENAGPGPGDRQAFGLVRDPVRDRLTLFGGAAYVYGSSDTWETPLDVPAWTRVDEGTPQLDLPFNCWSVRDSKRDRMIVMIHDPPNSRLMTLSLDTFLWTAMSVSGTPPPDRTGVGAIYDPADDRVIVFGGHSSAGESNETWMLELGDAPHWMQLLPAGTPPSPRENMGCVLDTAGDRMIVAGGYNGSAYTNDVWTLNVSGAPGWSPLATSGMPPASIKGTTVFDELGHRLLVTVENTSVAILSLGGSPTWSSVPGNFTSLTLWPIYDGARNRLICYESAVLYQGARYWAFDLDSLNWRELHPTGTPPGPGAKDNGILAMQFDRHRNRLVAFGQLSCTGLGHCVADNGTYLWDFGSPEVSVEPAVTGPGRSGLVSIEPSPAREAQTFRFRIAEGDVPRVLEVYTVDGRRIWSAPVATTGSGTHTLRWDGRTTDLKRAPAAVYFARLVTASGSSTRRFIRL